MDARIDAGKRKEVRAIGWLISWSAKRAAWIISSIWCKHGEPWVTGFAAYRTRCGGDIAPRVHRLLQELPAEGVAFLLARVRAGEHGSRIFVESVQNLDLYRVGLAAAGLDPAFSPYWFT